MTDFQPSSFTNTQFSPDRNLNRNKPVRGAVEIGDPAKFRRKNQRTFQIVRPAMIGTAQILGSSFGFRHYSCGMMTADVEEATQNIVISYNDDDWFAGDITCDVVAWIAQLIRCDRRTATTAKGPFFARVRECEDLCTKMMAGLTPHLNEHRDYRLR